MRVNLIELVELEPIQRIDEIRRFSIKELRLTRESMGALTKSSEYCGPISLTRSTVFDFFQNIPKF